MTTETKSPAATDMELADTTLAPCPFCGGRARQSQGGEGEAAWFGTGCGGSQGCPAYLRGLTYRTQRAADEAWNRRAQAPSSGTHAVGLAEFALRALVAADHVTQAKVDAAEHADAAENALKGVPPQGPALVPLSEAELKRRSATGPVYSVDGVVTRGPIEYRNELAAQYRRGFRDAEAEHGIKQKEEKS